jgi:uncharacterized protein (TIGR00369 family)
VTVTDERGVRQDATDAGGAVTGGPAGSVERRVTGAQNVSRMCMVCGRDNPSSLKARFYELEGGDVLGVFAPLEIHQSYPGRVHGGIVSAMLDETIGRAVNVLDHDAWGVTVELTVKFRKPVPVGQEVRVLARLTRDTSRLFEGSGEIRLADGTLAAEATGRYMKMPIDRIAEGDFSLEWFEDSRERPGIVSI